MLPSPRWAFIMPTGRAFAGALFIRWCRLLRGLRPRLGRWARCAEAACQLLPTSIRPPSLLASFNRLPLHRLQRQRRHLLRREFGQGEEDEGALVHARVGHGQLR